ncbi:hypothetical protein AMS69_17765 [Haloarcula rubripromontorii]|uniref:Uncharacterized protein n=1 Tax=Haloarcula rubripromontorii TaxID=1705562 RepID=A0A0N0BMZ2_9EURY|nr:hypothetical protein [Haloarcula rubripromontorii]KOX91573.1 hypothetical protein AMS69_17765 [Haloarcula rubripromontorii]
MNEEVQQPDLDDLSERILAFVRATGEDGATVSDIVDAYDDLTEDDRGRIHDRINRKLEPSGHVEREEDAIETDGGVSDAHVFRLTEWGEMYLNERDEPVTDAAEAADVQVGLAEAVGRIEDVETRVDVMESEVGERLEGFGDRLGRAEDEVEGAAEAVQGAVSTADTAREDAEEAVDEVEELREQVEDLDDAVAILEKQLEDEKERREEMLGDLDETDGTVAARLEWIEENVRWFRQKVDEFDGLFDELSESSLLRGWRRGE